jgi:hypothetical protein
MSSTSVISTAIVAGRERARPPSTPAELPRVEQIRAAKIDQVAQRLFEVYNGQGPNPWKTFDGRDVPRWPELTDQVRAKWRAAAEEAIALGAKP